MEIITVMGSGMLRVVRRVVSGVASRDILVIFVTLNVRQLLIVLVVVVSEGVVVN